MTTLEKIQWLIAEKYGTDKGFEDALGIPNRTVNDWKRGKSKSYMKLIPKIATVFGVSTDYLLTDEEEHKNTPPETKQTVSSGEKKKAPLVWGYDDDSVGWTHINTKKDKKNLSDSQTIEPQSEVDAELFKLIQQLPNSEKYKLIGRIQATLDLLK